MCQKDAKLSCANRAEMLTLMRKRLLNLDQAVLINYLEDLYR